MQACLIFLKCFKELDPSKYSTKQPLTKSREELEEICEDVLEEECALQDQEVCQQVGAGSGRQCDKDKDNDKEHEKNALFKIGEGANRLIRPACGRGGDVCS